MANHIPKLNKVLFVAIAVMVASLACAFDTDQPKGAKFFPEQSQEQLKAQQSFQGKFGVVGEVPDQERPVEPNGSIGNTEDNGSFASAEASKAKDSFASAARQIRDRKNPVSPFFILSMLAGVILLGVVAVKTYSDKVVPLPERLKH